VIKTLTELLSYDFSRNWAVLALVIIMTALTMRYILLRDSFRAVKSMGKETYRQVIHQYAGQSLTGWLYIALACLSAEFLIIFPGRLPFWLPRKEWMLAAAVFFLLGIFFHVRAIHFATVSVSKENGELDRTF